MNASQFIACILLGFVEVLIILGILGQPEPREDSNDSQEGPWREI